MKYLLLMVCASSSLIAMQKPNCYFAHEKFLAMSKTCKNTKITFLTHYSEQQVKKECVENYFKQFQKDCAQEELTKK